MYFVLSSFKEKNIVDQNKVTVDNDNDPLIRSYFFKVNKRFVLLRLPFCQNNEIKSKHFLKKFIILQKKNWYYNQLGNKENRNCVLFER